MAAKQDQRAGAPRKRSAFADDNEVARGGRGPSADFRWEQAEDRERAGVVTITARWNPDLVPRAGTGTRLRYQRLWNYQVRMNGDLSFLKKN